MYISILLALIISATQHLSERFHTTTKPYKSQLISLSAGISVTYIFLQLLPEFDEWINNVEPMYLFLLLGFICFHVSEKYIYKHATGQKRQKELSEFHSFMIGLYYFVVGISLASLAQFNFLLAFLFIIPVVLHTVAKNLSYTRGEHYVCKSKIVEVFLHISVILGAIAGVLIPLSSVVRAGFVGFTAGALLYIVIKEELPTKEKGNPGYFIVGVLTYVAFISVQWLS